MSNILKNLRTRLSQLSKRSRHPHPSQPEVPSDPIVSISSAILASDKHYEKFVKKVVRNLERSRKLIVEWVVPHRLDGTALPEALRAIVPAGWSVSYVASRNTLVARYGILNLDTPERSESCPEYGWDRNTTIVASETETSWTDEVAGYF